MADNFDTLSISTHLRELQQEKKKLENKFEHLQLRRKDLEAKHETVAKKNLLLHQKKDNMSRTANVAKMKVHETQLHVDKLQKINDGLQKTVLEVKQKLADEETEKEEMLNSFLEQYDELGDSFRNAKVYYLDESLEKEEEKWKNMCEGKKLNVSQNQEIIKEISKNLGKMQLLEEKVLEEKPPKSVWEQFNENKAVARQIFEEGDRLVSERLEKLTTKTSQSVSSMKELDDKLIELKQEICK